MTAKDIYPDAPDTTKSDFVTPSVPWLETQLAGMKKLVEKYQSESNDFRRIIGVDPDENHAEALVKAGNMKEAAWKYEELSK